MTEKEVAKTEADYYAIPDEIKAELIDGKLFYMESPSVAHQRKVKVGIYDDLVIDFSQIADMI